jgi:hypothetical protein
MKTQIALHGGRGCVTREKSLYPYFLNCGAEEWIERAVRASLGKLHDQTQRRASAPYLTAVR